MSSFWRSRDFTQPQRVGLAPAVGYAAPLRDGVYLWPQVMVGVSRVKASIGDVELAEHVMIGFGPAVERDLKVTVSEDGESRDGSKDTVVAGMASLVGWF